MFQALGSFLSPDVDRGQSFLWPEIEIFNFYCLIFIIFYYAIKAFIKDWRLQEKLLALQILVRKAYTIIPSKIVRSYL
jgi:hypothetical protein